eukprot:TRINITY_DN16012_c0_g1_i3.p1 TRINITY_DN16012_c0_g1~~TRINITY_DN16012_c0_g1_i3.p1  ORF type:complete len:111 (+),score=22.04 TRINITY_DN16012_c0_g1_i3:202-534(+)
MQDPEFSQAVTKFQKEHQHEIALNKSRDLEQLLEAQNQSMMRTEAGEGLDSGLMGPPRNIPKMPAPQNRHNQGNMDKVTLMRKKIHGGGFLKKWPQQRAWGELESVFGPP